jgi:ribosomal protein S12 methylthiotransferase accessory factor
VDTQAYYANYDRAQSRRGLAQHLWTVSYARLLEYGISSYRDITELDTIGIPVWIAYRPAGTSISVTCGKSVDPILAFAGAIVEALEVWAAENPQQNDHPFTLCPYSRLKELGNQFLPLTEYPLARDNVIDEQTPVAWELVTKLGSAAKLVWMPSNMIWLVDRSAAQFQDVQQSSNGLAAGCTLEDALLQAIYELVERDGWTINQYIRESTGRAPRKIGLTNLPPELALLVQQMRDAGCYPFLFDCKTDLMIPVIGCALFDRDNIGTFGGYGCSLSPRIAAGRALTEAAQSRLCYISGARDDLYRRDFLLMKRSSSQWIISQLEALQPTFKSWADYPKGYESFNTTRDELLELLKILNNQSIDLYYKTLHTLELEGVPLVIVKAIAPKLEGVWCDSWQTSGRANDHLQIELQGRTDG